MSLEEPINAWEDAVVKSANRSRYIAEEKLIAAGYSINDSVSTVERIITEAPND